MKLLTTISTVALLASATASLSQTKPDFWFRLGHGVFGPTATGGTTNPGGGTDTDPDTDPEDCPVGSTDPDCQVPGTTPNASPLRFVSVDAASAPIATLTPAGSPLVYTGTVVVGGGEPTIDLKFNPANVAGDPPTPSFGISFVVGDKTASFRSSARNCGGTFEIAKSGSDWTYKATIEPRCYSITALPLVATDSKGKTARWNPPWKAGPADLFVDALPATIAMASGTGSGGFTFEANNTQPLAGGAEATFDAPASTFACGVAFPATCTWTPRYGNTSADLVVVTERTVPNQWTGQDEPLTATIRYTIANTTPDPYTATSNTFEVTAATRAGGEFPFVSTYRPSIRIDDYFSYPDANTVEIPNTNRTVDFALPHLPVAFVSVDAADGMAPATGNVVLKGDGPVFDLKWDAAHLAELKTAWTSKNLDGSVSADGRTLSISTDECSSTMVLQAAQPGGRNWSWSATPSGSTATCAVSAPFGMVATDSKNGRAVWAGDDGWLSPGTDEPPVIVDGGTRTSPSTTLDTSVPGSTYRQDMPDVRDVRFTSKASKVYVAFVRDLQLAGDMGDGQWQTASGGYFYPPRLAWAKPENMPGLSYYIDQYSAANPGAPAFEYVQPTSPLLYAPGGAPAQSVDARGTYELTPVGRTGDLYEYKMDWKTDYYVPEGCGSDPIDDTGYMNLYWFGTVRIVVGTRPIDLAADPTVVPKTASITAPVSFRTPMQNIRANCVSVYK